MPNHFTIQQSGKNWLVVYPEPLNGQHSETWASEELAQKRADVLNERRTFQGMCDRCKEDRRV